MPAQLVSLSEGPSILLDKPIMLIGRHQECDIQIDSRKISRRHCCIAQVNDYLVVRDLGSTNGVRINGVRVLEGRLRAEDELTIGGNRYRVTWNLLPDSGDQSQEPVRQRSELERPYKPVPSDDDEMLEDAEEPIPLAEPYAPPPKFSGRKAAGPEAEKAHEPIPRAPRTDGSLGEIIPDHLDLAPPSDMEMKPIRPSK